MNTSKQLVVWATALRHRVVNDTFFLTRVRIIGYLTLFAALISIGISMSIHEALQKDSPSLFASIWTRFLEQPQSLFSLAFELLRDHFAMIAAILLTSTAFGIIVSGIALAPMHHIFDMQKRFVSALAHELRTPLSILRMNNEIMRHEVEQSSALSAFIDENIVDIDRIYEMLNNHLVFERLTKATALRYDEVTLPPIVASVVSKCADLAEQKRITVRVEDAVIPSVLGNATSIEQVFFNIIKNALLYTPKGGAVTVTYGTRDGADTVTITDTGVGISEKDLPHVFEPFYRTGRIERVAGTGIGLAIVQEIMRLHNGSIELASTEGKGTSFTLVFPVFAKEAAAAISPSSHITLSFSK